jgi:hypothetical protein
MGCCICFGGDRFPASSPSQCHIDCKYSEYECHGNCAFTSTIANHLTAKYGHDDAKMRSFHPIFSNVYELRDKVLSETPKGQELLRLYYETSQRAAEIVQADPELLEETTRLFLVAGNFAQNVSAVRDGQADPQKAQQRLDAKYFQDGRRLLARFRKQAPNPAEFNRALSYGERVLSQFEGLTAATMLDEMKKGA